MIRKVITPEKRNISIDVPQNFVGKQVEIIVFTIDDAAQESIVMDEPVTHYASEKSLAKDWLTPEEDKAWQDL